MQNTVYLDEFLNIVDVIDDSMKASSDRFGDNASEITYHVEASHTFAAVYDIKTQEVLELKIYDHKDITNSSRWTHETCTDGDSEEFDENIFTDYTNPEVLLDMMKNWEYSDYSAESGNQDNTIQLDLTDDEFLAIAKMAHSQDVTFNEMVNKALVEMLEVYKGQV